jgi:hypothetical protein
MAVIFIRKEKKEALQKVIDDILETKQYKGQDVNTKKYNKAKFKKFFAYTTDHMAYRRTMANRRKYRVELEQDELLMQIINDVRDMKMKRGTPARITVAKLKEDLHSYLDGDWEDEHDIPSIAGFLIDYSSQRMSEQYFYKLVDKHGSDAEFVELKEKLKTLRKYVIDTGAVLGRFDGRYVGNAMRQDDVSAPWDQVDANKLDGKKGWADLVKEALGGE